MKVVFFGSSSYILPIIEALNTHFDLALVVTTEKNSTDPIPAYCLTHSIHYISTKQFNNETIETIVKASCQIGVLASFGLFIPEKILELFPLGILNIHPSLLPKYRGPTPVQTAILNGDKTTGVTIIKLDSELDHGSILTQVGERIFTKDTAESLYNRLFKQGLELLVSSLPQYAKGELSLKEQDHAKATYTNHLDRKNGYIDINNPPTKEIFERMIRAYYPWPGIWTRLRQGFGGQAKLKIIKFLPEEKIQVEGKKPVSVKDFLNGYPEAKRILQIL